MKVIMSCRFLLKMSFGNWSNNQMFTLPDMQSRQYIDVSKTSFGSQRAGKEGGFPCKKALVRV
jgi:hypothetical protein